MERYKFEDYMHEARFLAKKLIGRFGGRFEVDELVNESWSEFKRIRDPELEGFEKLSHLRNQMYWAMLDYIETRLGKKDRPNLKRGHGRVFNNWTRHNDNEAGVEDLLMSEKVQGVYRLIEAEQNLSARQELMEIFAKLKFRDYSSMVQYHIHGRKMKAIGDDLNKTECTISASLKRGMRGCKELIECSPVLYEKYLNTC